MGRKRGAASQCLLGLDWTPFVRAVWAALFFAAGLWAPGALSGGIVPPPQARDCALDKVLDGDSLLVRCSGESVEVRLYCIDAPEHGQVPWDRQSRRHLRGLAAGRLRLVLRERDRFGRAVGEVYAPGPGGALLNLEQVRSGNAAVYRRYCEDPRFERAESEARAAHLGIWSRPGEQQRPWDYRHRQRR